MKINEYKNEVSSLRLDDDFKAKLKETLLEAAKENAPESARDRGERSGPAVFARKYSRYIALAACILLVVSTVSIVSIGGLPFAVTGSKSADNNATVADAPQDTDGEDIDERDQEAPAEAAADGTGDIADEPNLMSAEINPDMPADDSEPDVIADDVDDESVPVESVDDEPDAEEDSEVVSEEVPEEIPASIPATSAPYSSFASPEYDGDYNGDDYILWVSGDMPSNYALVSMDDIQTVPSTVVPIDPIYPAPDSESVPAYPEDPNNSTPSGAGTDTSNVDVVTNVDEEVDETVEEPQAPTESVDFPETSPTSQTGYDDDSDSANSEFQIPSVEILTEGSSYGYYDIRDGVIAKLDNVGLIRFSVEDSYTGYGEVSLNAAGVTMDTTTQTLYKITVKYDYFSSEDPEAERLLLNDGTEHYQMVGRPLMQGEYIAVVTENSDNVLVPIPELIYAVHNVNGLDIAYHLYSSDGFDVDPGSTNMGILPEEQMIITSTANNPEVYTQKAAVRELTYYLRRNILRLEPTLISFKEPEPLRSRITANFPTGKLTLSVPEPDSDGLISVNGISVGSSLDDALKAFLLSEYQFEQTCTLKLVASEEDGKWSVTVYVTDGVVSAIEPSALPQPAE